MKRVSTDLSIAIFILTLATVGASMASGTPPAGPTKPCNCETKVYEKEPTKSDLNQATQQTFRRRHIQKYVEKIENTWRESVDKRGGKRKYRVWQVTICERCPHQPQRR
jgi:hypothetical protein